MAILVDVIGRLGNKPEIRTSVAGNEFMTFNLAVEDFNKGEKETVWFTVADFSNNIKKKVEFLNKGSMVHVVGEEKVRIYHDRENNPKIARDIRVSFLSFVSTSNSGSSKQEEQAQDVNCGNLPQGQPIQETAPSTNSSGAPIPPQSQTISNQTTARTQRVQQPATVATNQTNDIEDDLPF